MSEPGRSILVAEDDESERMILKMAFEKAQLPESLVLVCDGQEAVDYLSGKGRYTDRSANPLPSLVVLDLKMPRMNGFDVLDWIGKQSELHNLPAVILSSSSDHADIQKARQLGARDYFVKPHSFDELGKIIHGLHTRWLH